MNRIVGEDMSPFPYSASTSRETAKAGLGKLQSCSTADKMHGSAWMDRPALDRADRLPLILQPILEPRAKLLSNELGDSRRKGHLKTMVAYVPGQIFE